MTVSNVGSKTNSTAFSLDVSEDGIGWITIDVVGESQNTLKAEFVDDINALFDDIESNSAIKALVLISGKETNFIAGADITQLESIKTAQEAEELSLKGHQVFARLENISLPDSQLVRAVPLLRKKRD